MQRYSPDTTDSRKCGRNLCISRADTALKDGFLAVSPRSIAFWRVESRGQIETFIAKVKMCFARREETAP